jgi:hypothetical protein
MAKEPDPRQAAQNERIKAHSRQAAAQPVQQTGRSRQPIHPVD